MGHENDEDLDALRAAICSQEPFLCGFANKRDSIKAALALRSGMTAGPYTLEEREDGYAILAGGGGDIALVRFRSPAEFIVALLNAVMVIPTTGSDTLPTRCTGS